jgi:hypothetical protein
MRLFGPVTRPEEQAIVVTNSGHRSTASFDQSRRTPHGKAPSRFAALCRRWERRELGTVGLRGPERAAARAVIVAGLVVVVAGCGGESSHLGSAATTSHLVASQSQVALRATTPMPSLVVSTPAQAPAARSPGSTAPRPRRSSSIAAATPAVRHVDRAAAIPRGARRRLGPVPPSSTSRIPPLIQASIACDAAFRLTRSASGSRSNIDQIALVASQLAETLHALAVRHGQLRGLAGLETAYRRLAADVSAQRGRRSSAGLGGAVVAAEQRAVIAALSMRLASCVPPLAVDAAVRSGAGA